MLFFFFAFVCFFVGFVGIIVNVYSRTSKFTLMYLVIQAAALCVLSFLMGTPLQVITVASVLSPILIWVGGQYLLMHRDLAEASTLKHSSIANAVVVLSAISLLICIGCYIGSSAMFRASEYRDQITITKTVHGLPELTQSTKIPVDIELARDLMQKSVPPEISSRYTIGEITRQADSRGNIQYVAPLEHIGVIAALLNGMTPGYIVMDAADAISVKAVLTDKKGQALKLMYSNSAMGLQDINTYMHFNSPTSVLESAKFYLDDEGKPYWVALKQKRTIGVSGFDTEGVVVVNAQTGDIKEYDLAASIPSWIDRLHDTALLEEQVDSHFQYVHGYFNGSRQDVRERIGATDYVQIGDQTYLYITIGNKNNATMTTGAVLVNTRTKETSYYERKVFAETEVATAAAQLYREKGYSAGNPLLRSVEGNLVFVVQMHGAASTISGYVIRSAYPQGPISSGNTLVEAYQNYVQKMMEAPDVAMTKHAVANTREGQVSQLGSEVVNGNTVYSIRIEGSNEIFVVARTVSPELPLLGTHNTVAVQYRKGVKGVNTVYSLKVLK